MLEKIKFIKTIFKMKKNFQHKFKYNLKKREKNKKMKKLIF